MFFICYVYFMMLVAFSVSFIVLFVLILEVLLLLLVMRMRLALKRTPEREIYRLQRGPQKLEE